MPRYRSGGRRGRASYGSRTRSRPSYRGRAAPRSARRTGRAASSTSRLVVQVVAAPSQGQMIPHGFAAAPAPRTRKF